MDSDSCMRCGKQCSIELLDYIPHSGKLEEGTGVIHQIPVCIECQRELGITKTVLNDKGLTRITVSEQAFNFFEKLDSDEKL